MPDAGPIRIALLEDHVLLRDVLARSLATEPGFIVAGQCATVEDALELVSRIIVDIVLLDINLGAEQGGSFVTRARAGGFQGKVLVVTAGVSNREAVWLLKRGCAGVFLKQEPLSALVQRIRDVMSGVVSAVPEDVQQYPVAQVGARDLPHRRLTRRERQVLRAVCEGLANKEIAERLGVSENTVKSFLQQLFEKTGVRTRAQLVAAAIEQYWDQLDGV